MPTPTDFEDDLFISYAHIDNQPIAEGLKGWVETFHERLRVRLEQVTGESIRIWRDPKLEGNDIFAQTIVTRLSQAAVLVVVLTPRYVKSEWCLKELGEFCRCADGGAVFGDKLRVFKVGKFHVPVREHPLQLQGVLGFDFYEYDPERDQAREFSPDLTPARDRRYWDMLEDVVGSIKKTLQRLSCLDEALTACAGETVYLAETTSDLADERGLIRRELELQGHVVLPDAPLPLQGPALREAVRGYMERSTLSIHLLGAGYGLIPEEESRSLVEIQGEVAEGVGEKLRRIVWMPPGLEPRDERQRRLVEQFRLGADGRTGLEVLQTGLDELKKQVEERLNEQPQPAPAPAGGGGAPSVYLICDREDLPETAPLEDFLFESGFDVLLPALEGDEQSVRDCHKQMLAECDGVVVYYGRGSDAWLRMKQLDLQKVAGYGRTRPLPKAIYVTGPPTPVKERLRSREALVVQSFDGHSFDDLALFVEQVRKGVSG